jgi:endonuclease-3 related protein
MQNFRMDARCHLLYIYELLDAHFGDLHWWPGDTPFEVIVGAILTQNTAWRNVEKAIENLKSNGYLSPEKILTLDDHILSDLVRSSGYHHVKTQRLKSFVRYLYEKYDGSLDALFSEDMGTLRKNLLKVNGIGEETANSIILYAGSKPVFVVDAYTRRILERHGMISGRTTYADIQKLFMNHLPGSVPLYKQYHALLVNTGKLFCRMIPQCDGCPLKTLTVKKRCQNA